MKRLLLIVSLFGIMAQAMEPMIIKDINGSQLELAQAQKNALGQCKTLKRMLAVCGSQTIDFERIPAPVVKEDLEYLACLIENPKKLDQIPAAKIIPLFKLADYLHVPKAVGQLLAEKSEQIIEDRIAQLERFSSWNEEQTQEFGDLQMVRQSLEKHLGIPMAKWLEKTKARRSGPERAFGIINLSYDQALTKNKTKLRSLKGIEKLENPSLVAELQLDNHTISSVNIAYLQKLFPHLHKLSLKNNHIENISETKPMRGIEVNLKGNPLQSITIEKPEQSNYVIFKTDNPNVKVEFKQDAYPKKLTWFKSLAAKLKVARGCFFPPTGWLLLFAGVGVGYKLLESNFSVGADFYSDPANSERLVVASKYLRMIVSGPSAAQEILEILRTGDPEAMIITVKELAALLPPQAKEIVQEPMFQKWFLAPAKTGFKSMCILAGLFILKHFMFDDDLFTCFPRDLDWMARRNPYRVRVAYNDQVIKDFPSNYTYNLFGKN